MIISNFDYLPVSIFNISAPNFTYITSHMFTREKISQQERQNLKTTEYKRMSILSDEF